MILKVELARTILQLLSIIIGYAIVSTLGGMFKAWIAYYLGDETGVEHGYGQPNPLVHCSITGTLAILLLGVGWGSTVPVHYADIIGRWQGLKRFVVAFSDTFFYFISAVFGVVTLVLMHGSRVVDIVAVLVGCRESLDSAYIIRACPSVVGFNLTLSYLIIVSIYFAVIMSVYSIFNNIIHLMTYNEDEYGAEIDYNLRIFLLIMFIFSVSYIKDLVIRLILYSSSFLVTYLSLAR